jgi:hypothetical protein
MSRRRSDVTVADHASAPIQIIGAGMRSVQSASLHGSGAIAGDNRYHGCCYSERAESFLQGISHGFICLVGLNAGLA